MINFYINDFLLLYTANFLNLISPGAGFSIVVYNSNSISKKIGIVTAMGIVCSSIFHKTYTFMGFGLIISQNPYFFNLIKYIGCFYLFYLGINLLKNKNKKNSNYSYKKKKNNKLNKKQAFQIGFFTDLLNPQASLCFLMIVRATIRPETTLLTQGIYGLILIITSIIWYISVVLFFSHPILTKKIKNIQYLLKKITGISLIFFAYKIFIIKN